MTDAEKKMKKYTSAIERKLNLPRELKVRVMSDLISSIEARREAGLSDSEIYTELGSPKKAAADLNEQMKAFTYRKSPWRYLFAACAAYGAAELLGGLIAWISYLFLTDPFLALGEASTIGIIGGADGPTAVFVTTPGWMHYINPCLFLIIGIWGFLYFSRRKRK